MPRARLTGQGSVAVSDDEMLVGITDLKIAEHNGQQLLYSTSRGGGWLNRFTLDDQQGSAALSDSWAIPTQWLQLTGTDIALVSNSAGGTDVMLAGLQQNDLRGQVETGNQLGAAARYDAGAFDMGDISAIDMSPDGTQAIASLRAGGLAQLEFGANGQVSVSAHSGLAALSSARANAVEWTNVDGADYAVVAYAATDQVVLLRADASGQMRMVDTVAPSDGAWIDRPGEVVTVSGADGESYVVMAASGSNSLTVLKIDGNALIPVDHMLDSLDTRFDDASQLAAMEVNGQPYVVAAGRDQGLTVLTVLPGGQLLEVATIAASYETPLNGITDIEVATTPDGAQIYVATQGPPYLVQFEFSLENAGATLTGTADSNTLTGTQADDVLSGGAGNDVLFGGNGDDILADGTGADRLTGGNGADLFILEADGAVDRIEDFQAGTDTIMLTAPHAGLDASDIQVLSRSYGAEIRLEDEVLRVYSQDGGSLTLADFESGGLQLSENISTDLADFVDDAPDYGPESGSTLSATLRFDLPAFDFETRAEPEISVTIAQYQQGSTAGGEQIQGRGTNDRIEGGASNDILVGAGGFDTLMGGDGDDQLSGGRNGDRLEGGQGNDIITGGDGFDMMYGDAGDDQMWGGVGPDRIWGGEGDDWIDAGFNFGFSVDGVDGGAGNDTIFGGVGFDILFGGDGNDVIDGGHHADNIYGQDGDDIIYGNLGFDRMFGGNGHDQIYGGAGPDTHFGGGDNDRMWGGEGHDRFFGESGNDYIEGGTGNDSIGGNAGFDTLVGGEGNDLLYGDFNADRFVFEDGHGHDTVADFDAQNALEVLDFSGLNSFGVTSDVMSNAQQVGRNVVITTDADSSITLVNVDLSDLDGTDFLF